MIHLVEIIRTKCLPERDCLLSVTDQRGESGFLYFKDGELIEVNQGSVWGKEAFHIILKWQLSDYAISAIPMGIKRTIWEPIDKLIEEVLGDGSGHEIRETFKTIPSLPTNEPITSRPINPPTQTIKIDAEKKIFLEIEKNPNCRALFLESEMGIERLSDPKEGICPDETWLQAFHSKNLDLGKALGGGKPKKIFIKTEQFLLWKIPVTNYQIIVIASPQTDTEVFENFIEQILSQNT
jgi:hypothetical protein